MKNISNFVNNLLDMVLIDNDGFYYCSGVFCTMLLAFSYMLRAAVLMLVLMYSWSLNFSDVHVVLCTFGYHFFSAEAIMSLNYANGWSRNVKPRHRRLIHVFLQICGLACVGVGTALITIDKGISGSAHDICGLLAAVFAAASLVTGACACGFSSTAGFKIFHLTLGLPTIIASSVCLCLGLFTDHFKSWSTTNFIHLAICFISFYTIFIVMTTIMKCAARYLR